MEGKEGKGPQQDSLSTVLRKKRRRKVFEEDHQSKHRLLLSLNNHKYIFITSKK